MSRGCGEPYGPRPQLRRICREYRMRRLPGTADGSMRIRRILRRTHRLRVPYSVFRPCLFFRFRYRLRIRAFLPDSGAVRYSGSWRMGRFRGDGGSPSVFSYAGHSGRLTPGCPELFLCFLIVLYICILIYCEMWLGRNMPDRTFAVGGATVRSGCPLPLPKIRSSFRQEGATA